MHQLQHLVLGTRVLCTLLHVFCRKRPIPKEPHFYVASVPLCRIFSSTAHVRARTLHWIWGACTGTRMHSVTGRCSCFERSLWVLIIFDILFVKKFSAALTQTLKYTYRFDTWLAYVCSSCWSTVLQYIRHVDPWSQACTFANMSHMYGSFSYAGPSWRLKICMQVAMLTGHWARFHLKANSTPMLKHIGAKSRRRSTRFSRKTSFVSHLPDSGATRTLRYMIESSRWRIRAASCMRARTTAHSHTTCTLLHTWSYHHGSKRTKKTKLAPLHGSQTTHKKRKLCYTQHNNNLAHGCAHWPLTSCPRFSQWRAATAQQPFLRLHTLTKYFSSQYPLYGDFWGPTMALGTNKHAAHSRKLTVELFTIARD